MLQSPSLALHSNQYVEKDFHIHQPFSIAKKKHAAFTQRVSFSTGLKLFPKHQEFYGQQAYLVILYYPYLILLNSP